MYKINKKSKKVTVNSSLNYKITSKKIKSINTLYFSKFMKNLYKQKNGGPDRIRTNDQAVAVPCLTTWLQGHFHRLLIITQ